MLQWIVLAIVLVVALAIAGVLYWVQAEAPFQRATLFEHTGKRTLILFHPSRDAHFADNLTDALAAGFDETGLAVDRWPMTRHTPAKPEGYSVIAIVSNTFFGSPDWPTLRYLKRARLDGQQVIAIMAGSGNTRRAEKTLNEAINRTGAQTAEFRPLWTSRPNEPGSDGLGNWQVAMRLAHGMARTAGEKVT